MAAITQIVENERENTDHIHLYKEGLFFKAYQHSAFLFHTQVRNFRPVRKFYKAVGCEVVMLGFPSVRLDEIFPGDNVEKIDDWHVSIPCPKFDPDIYQRWFDSAELLPVRERKPSRSQPEAELPIGEGDLLPDVETIPVASYRIREYPPAPGAAAGENVLREIEAFAIENATPIECMVFLSKLKSELKKGSRGGL